MASDHGVCLDDFPDHRRDFLLWRFMLWPYFYDVEAVDEVVREAAGGSCLVAAGAVSDEPVPRGSSPAARQIRMALIESSGVMCHCCGQAPGFGVDHDQFTGYVRGLLCHYCASHVDDCPHLAGCVFAAYLNEPPALKLGLLFYRPSRVSSTAEQKIEQLGFNPLFTGRSRVRLGRERR